MYSSHKLFCIISLVCTVLNAAESESTPIVEIASSLSLLTTQSPVSESTASESEQPVKPSRKRQREERLPSDEIIKRGILLAFEQSRVKALANTPHISASPVKVKRQKQMTASTASEELIKITMKALADKVNNLEESFQKEKTKVATLEKNQLTLEKNQKALMLVIIDMQKRLFISPMLASVHESEPVLAMDTLTPIPEELSFERFANANPLNQNGFAQPLVQQKIFTKVPDVLT